MGIFEEIVEFAQELSKKKAKGTTSKGTWKDFESTVASFFGSHRTPLSGMVSTLTGADTLHKDLFIECKYRTDYPIFTTFREEQKANKSKTTIVALTKSASRYDKPLWLFDYKDLQKVIHIAEMLIQGDQLLESHNKKYHFKEVKGEAAASLYKKTEVQAKDEGKLPLVAIKKKHQKGWLIVINPYYLNQLSKII